MKKLLALCLTALLLTSLLGGALAEITYPIVTDKPVTLTVWMPMNAGASQVFTSYNENPIWAELAKKTGVSLNFIHPTYGATAEGFSTMLAGSNLPDIIMHFPQYYNGGLVGGYEDGVIYDLTPYLEEYAPDYYALINQNADVRRQFYNEDDQVLAFFGYQEEADSLSDYLIVRPDWCEEFGIDPATLTTFDKLEVYFQKVLDNKPGVIPFLTNVDKTFTTLGAGYNVFRNFYQVDGTVYHYANTDTWRAFLSRLNSWFEKGYLGVDFGTAGNTQIRKQYSAGKVASLIAPIGNVYSDSVASGTPIYKTPFQSFEEGAQIHVYNLNVDKRMSNEYTAVVTTKCDEKLLPVICQFFNFGYTTEGSRYISSGPDGLSWNYDENGKVVFTDWVVKNELYETSIMHNVCRFTYYPGNQMKSTECSPNLMRDAEVLRLRLMWADMEGWDNAWLMPSSVTLTIDENEERSEIMANADTYIAETALQFVRGTLDVDDDAAWNAYTAQLTNLKLEEAIEITQNAYNRYIAR